MSDEPEQDESHDLGPYLDLVLRPFPDAVLDALDVDQVSLDIEFAEGALDAFPDNLDALKALGNAYTAAKRYVHGLNIDKRLVCLCPRDPVVRYNLACSYALVGDKDLAFEALRLAIDLGYDEFDHLVEDPDLASLHDDPRFDALLHPRE